MVPETPRATPVAAETSAEATAGPHLEASGTGDIAAAEPLIAGPGAQPGPGAKRGPGAQPGPGARPGPGTQSGFAAEFGSAASSRRRPPDAGEPRPQAGDSRPYG